MGVYDDPGDPSTTVTLTGVVAATTATNITAID